MMRANSRVCQEEKPEQREFCMMGPLGDPIVSREHILGRSLEDTSHVRHS